LKTICERAAEDGYGRLGSPTLVDDYSIRLQLEHLWNADRCPVLSREQRVERIREFGEGCSKDGLFGILCRRISRLRR
jgi:hypothetical protein